MTPEETAQQAAEVAGALSARLVETYGNMRGNQPDSPAVALAAVGVVLAQLAAANGWLIPKPFFGSEAALRPLPLVTAQEVLDDNT